MSETFDLTLDTQAPVVSFGVVSNPVAGLMLAVAYTVDEVGTLVATLTLADNRQFTMGDTGTEFRYVLPLDTPTGNVTVEVEAEDDLGNVETYSTSFAVTGAAGIDVVPVGPDRTAGITPTAADPATRLLEHGSRVEVRSSRRVLAMSTRRAALETSTLRLASAGVINRQARIHVGVLHVISSSRVVISTAQPETEIAVFKRADGPKTEEALVVLGLL